MRVVRGDIANARVLASELLASNASKEPMVAASAWWILACDAAVRGNLSGYDRAAGQAIEVGGTAIVEVDMATVAQRAGDLIAVHDRARAAKAWAFANDKWKALADLIQGLSTGDEEERRAHLVEAAPRPTA